MDPLQKPTNLTLTAPRAFRLEPATRYVATLGDGGSGAATLQLWDGVAWFTLPGTSSGASLVAEFVTPPTGRVRVNVTAGAIVFSAVPVSPTPIRNA